MKIDIRELHPPERKIMAAGFEVGRRGGSPDECPHPIRKAHGKLVGRKGQIWVRGYVLGTAELDRVRQSYRNALESIDAGPPPCPWR